MASTTRPVNRRAVPAGHVDCWDAAKRIGCSERTVRTLIAEGEIPSILYKPSRRRIMRIEDVDAYIGRMSRTL